MPLTFAERQQIMRRAVESRKARKASRLMHKATGRNSHNNGNSKAIVEEAVAAGKMSKDARQELTAYQRLADLEPDTLVRHYDEGWRYAYLLEAGRTRTRLRTVPLYKGTSRNFRTLTVNVEPVEEGL